MAKYGNGYMGGFSGRLGPAVGYCWRGKWCLRSHQPLVRNPRTEAQQRHRMMFKQEVQLAGRLHWVLRHTFEELSYGLHMTPYNYFVSRNQHAFSWVDDALAVDWASLVLSEGPVAPVAFGTPQVDDDNVLRVSFERNPLHVRANSFDSVYLYVYCPAVGTGYLAAPVYRHDGRVAVALPDQYRGCEVQLWGMVQDREGRWSQTLYVGHGPLETCTLEACGMPAGSGKTETPAVGEATAGVGAVAASDDGVSAAGSAPH